MNTIYVISIIIAFLLGTLAFIDLIYRNYKKEFIPFYWLMIIFFIPLIGTLLYFYLKPWERVHNKVQKYNRS